MQKVAIIGSRSINDLSLLEKIWKDLQMPYIDISIISGGAKGADTNGEEFANKYNMPIIIYKPDWNRFGKSAGFRRNIDIIKNCDICIAIWDGKSQGTKHSMDLCKAYFKRLYVWNNAPGYKRLFTYKYDNTQLELF